MPPDGEISEVGMVTGGADGQRVTNAVKAAVIVILGWRNSARESPSVCARGRICDAYCI